MRNKIDYRIDLGTTNSAIARMENGVPTIEIGHLERHRSVLCSL